MKKFLLLLAVILIGFGSANGQVAVIVNKSVAVETADTKMLSSIYKLTKQHWDDGEKVVIFDHKKKSDTKKKFYAHLGVKPNKLKKEWLRAQLTGAGTAPKALKSDDDVLKKVASTAGAIGYIDASKADDSVKVIAKIE